MAKKYEVGGNYLSSNRQISFTGAMGIDNTKPELETQLILAERLKYIVTEDISPIINEIQSVDCSLLWWQGFTRKNDFHASRLMPPAYTEGKDYPYADRDEIFWSG